MKTKLRNFFLIFLCNCKIKFYFCITKTSLSYGVMVTQQILVLLFLVRIQELNKTPRPQGGGVFVCIDPSGNIRPYTDTTTMRAVLRRGLPASVFRERQERYRFSSPSLRSNASGSGLWPRKRT